MPGKNLSFEKKYKHTIWIIEVVAIKTVENVKHKYINQDKVTSALVSYASILPPKAGANHRKTLIFYYNPQQTWDKSVGK